MNGVSEEDILLHNKNTKHDHDKKLDNMHNFTLNFKHMLRNFYSDFLLHVLITNSKSEFSISTPLKLDLATTLFSKPFAIACSSLLQSSSTPTLIAFSS